MGHGLPCTRLTLAVGRTPELVRCMCAPAMSTVMEMLAHHSSNYKSMFSCTALVYRRSRMCRFECNVHRVHVRRNHFCRSSRLAHSLVYTLPDSHGIIVLLVTSGKQPSSRLLRTLRFICVCCWPLTISVYNIYLRHLLHNTEALLVFQATLLQVSPPRLTSTTQPLATVPGYHKISITST